MLQALPIPSADSVLEANERFERDDRYGPVDRALKAVFCQYPANVHFEHVLIKVALVNSLYNTNILAVWQMARHIQSLGIDSGLRTADPNLVECIAQLTIGGRTRRHYSFATKYCSWHCPETFPIYDSLVARLLLAFGEHYRFAQFTGSSLRDYVEYKAILAAFMSYFGLESLSFKQIDRFLWLTGGELFGPRTPTP